MAEATIDPIARARKLLADATPERLDEIAAHDCGVSHVALAALQALGDVLGALDGARGPSITRADARELLEMSDTTTSEACYERVRIHDWIADDLARLVNERTTERDALRVELAESKRLRDEALRTFRAREDAIERAEKRALTAESERDALKHHYDAAGPEHNLAALLDLYDERRRDAILALEAACEESDAAIRERDARPPLATLPTEHVCGEWIMSGQAEPDAVVTYASEPSPETGHVGWCWWARGKMGDARDYMAAREAAERSLRAHAGRGKGE